MFRARKTRVYGHARVCVTIFVYRLIFMLFLVTSFIFERAGFQLYSAACGGWQLVAVGLRGGWEEVAAGVGAAPRRWVIAGWTWWWAFAGARPRPVRRRPQPLLSEPPGSITPLTAVVTKTAGRDGVVQAVGVAAERPRARLVLDIRSDDRVALDCSDSMAVVLLARCRSGDSV